MLKIALVDDDAPALSISESAIRGFFQSKGIGQELDTFSSSLSFLANSKEKKYDLAILDIDMPEANGIECAKQVLAQNFDTTIIFLSQREDLVFDCLSLHPFGFIRKSRIFEDFGKVMELYINTVYEDHSSAQAYITIRNKSEIITLKISDIVVVEGSRNYQKVTLKDGKEIQLRQSLNELTEKLKPFSFIRVHKGFIVNAYSIRRISSKEVILLDGSSLPLSLKNRDEIMEEYLKITRKTDFISMD